MWKAIVSAALLLSQAIVAQPVDSHTRTLVVVDRATDQAQYESVLESLRSRRHDVDVRDVHDEGFELLKHKQLEYDNLLVLPTTKTKSLGNRLNGKSILEFINAGGNVLAVTVPHSVPESLREVASELDIHIAPKGYKLVDHFIGSGAKHDELILTSNNLIAPASVSTVVDDVTVHAASGAYLGNSELVIPLIRGEETSFVYDARDEDEEVAKAPWVTGQQTYLAAALQGHNNARFLWVGSDELIKGKLGEEFTKWVFQEKSVLRTAYVQHRLQESAGEQLLYRVNDKAHYEIGLQAWNGEKWVPYEGDDVQLDFTMLDPYYRLNLNRSVEDDYAVYSADFTLPDQYGMFTFRVFYRRPGVSFIKEENVVTVRHIANDEWPRSWEITNSWVYLTSAVSVVIAWFVFTLMYLYSPADVSPEKKNQ